MTTKTVARCSIYGNRPEVCKKYPDIYKYLPSECTYTFNGEERRGDCSCDTGACCVTPREGGEPGGTPLPEAAGGSGCKYLVWEDAKKDDTEKTASAALPIVDDTRMAAAQLEEDLGFDS